MKKCFLAALALFLLLSFGCSQKDHFPPPGELIDIGGYRLHLQSQGTGSPTVIMEAGAGDFSLTWALVAPEIAKTNRVCTYDRAGMGWSDTSPNPRLATIEVMELHSLLQKANIQPPYVMVAHSYGGVLARLFTYTYSHEVSALVLVDPGHEEQKTRQDTDVQRSMTEAAANALTRLSECASKAASGTLTEEDVSSMVNAGLPEKEQAEYSYILRTKPTFYQTVISESGNLDNSFAQVKDMNITLLGNIPLIVISSSATMEMALTPELSVKADRVMRQLQSEISIQSTSGSHITAEGTTHYIQIVQPQIVINAIKQVLQ